jgi:hypothetical protein
MDTYLEKHGHEYDEKQKENMRRIDREARIEYEKKITKSYYTSRQFQLDIGKAAVKTGLKMGTRQVVGLFFTEIWFSVKEKFADIKGEFSLSAFFKSIGQGIEAGVKNAMAKYKEILSRLMEGAFAGFLSSITTTLCNIFFTTAQNVVKIIRQLWVSLVQAAKILFINPDNLPFGERMRAVARILSVGAGVVFGSITSQWIGTTAIGAVPVLGDIVQTFMGTLVTGIVSCSLIHFIDKSQIMNKLVNSLNAFNDMEKSLQYYQEQALYFEEYAAALMNIDLDLFEKETGVYIDLADAIEKASDQELQKVLHAALGRLNMKGPWGDDFNQFMRSKSSKLVFE